MLDIIRKEFYNLNIHAIIIPNADPHLSEYLPTHWQMIPWVSGFTGSAGTVVITRERAGLWTDSRYYLQAEQELDGRMFTLFKQGEKDTPSIIEFLSQHLEQGEVVALNNIMWSYDDLRTKEEQFLKHGLSITYDHQLIETLWNKNNRPALPRSEVFVHDDQFIGLSTNDKLAQIRSEMTKENVCQHVITSLDDIAWLYNLRGSDIDFNPIFLAYTIVEAESAILFVNRERLSVSALEQLNSNKITIRLYEGIYSHLKQIDKKILVNSADCNGALYDCIPTDFIVEGPTISRPLKACKMQNEVKHIENAMIKDGIALAKAFSHLFKHLNRITEAEFAAYIAEKRSEQENYHGESFPAIVGYQSNGAIVHYRPKKGSSAVIKSQGLLLCDSGGQYHDGTTDITRTIAVGALSQDQKVDYTNVLKGHIAIDQALFPEGTTGGQLDTLARQFLWKSGKNYGHGTGHGVGYFLNVHEPPQGISPGSGLRSTTAFKEGMITSNEPGYYKEGAYGIRIENLIVCEKSEHQGYLKHRALTLFPIDTSPVVLGMLNKEEIDWINKYHSIVEQKVAQHLTGATKRWFIDLCKKI